MTITNFTIDRPAPLEINRKIATMGGSDSHRGEKRASLCLASVCFLGVFCTLEKVGLPPEKKFIGGKTWAGPPIDATAKGELGVVDEILISYTNFAGSEFCSFDVESARVMGRIIAMENAMDHDRDEVVQTCGSLTKLEEIVLVNATGISELTTIMRENVSTLAALQRTVDETSTQVKTMLEALKEVTETANNAFHLALGAQPTITVHGVKLDALVDDVSKMSSDIDGFRVSYTSPPDHSTQLAQLEGTVSRIDSEFVALRKLLEKPSGPNMAGDSWTLPTADTSSSPDDVGTD